MEEYGVNFKGFSDNLTIVKPGPYTIDEELFRFDMFILLVSEWVRRKLKVKLSIECLR